MKKLLFILLFIPTLCSSQWIKTLTGNGDTVKTAVVGNKGIYDTTATASKFRMDSVIAALVGKQSSLVSGTNIKTVAGGSILGSGDLRVNNSLKINSALGSVVIAETLFGGVSAMTNNTGAFVDGRCMFYPIVLEKDATITGVKFYQTTAGNFTADNNNKVGLYSFNGTTLTLVASSTTDANLWKAAANTWVTKSFSATYAATAGVYFIGFLYNSSAQTTAPVIAGGAQTVTNAGLLDFTNSAKISCYINTQNDLPASQLMSGTTVNSITPYFAIY